MDETLPDEELPVDLKGLFGPFPVDLAGPEGNASDCAPSSLG